MSIINSGKFTLKGIDVNKATPRPSDTYDANAKERHDTSYNEMVTDAPIAPEAIKSGAVGYFEDGKFVEDEGRIILKGEYAEINIDCMNKSHRKLVSKVIGSIMEYISGQIQDFTSDVFIDDEIIPKVLSFYEEKHIELMDLIEAGDDTLKKHIHVINVSNNIFHESSLVKFSNMIQEFINGDINSDEYLSYLKAIKQRMKSVSKENVLLAEGKVNDIKYVNKV